MRGYNWIEIVTALSTLGAVIIALFGDLIRAKLSFLQPELKLELIEKPERSKTNNASTYLDTFYYYGKVSNTNRRVRAATQVQVSLIRLEPKALNEGEELYAKEVPIEWHLQNVKPLQLTLGSDQNFLICSITQEPWVAIHPITKPLVLKGTWRKPFRAVIIFQAKSVEVESNLLPLEIEWDGIWSADKDEVVKHLKVRVISITNEGEERDMSDEDNQRLISAGKNQRWEVIKWVTTVNMGLATASALISSREGKALVWEFLIATGLMAFFGLFLLWHYNKRITGVRKEAGGYGGRFYDWQELLVFGLIILLSPVPAWLLAIR